MSMQRNGIDHTGGKHGVGRVQDVGGRLDDKAQGVKGAGLAIMKAIVAGKYQQIM